MPERRALRLTVEVLFLAALALALAFTELRALAIVGLMLLGWVVVALYEWVATREQPHYGSGLPPRYYVPQVSLPPPRPLEQLPSGYPASAEARDDSPTWIASPAIRSEVLADWPVANPVPAARAEDTMVDDLMAVSVSEERAIDPWFDELDDPALGVDPKTVDAQPPPAPPEPAVDERPDADEVEPDEDEAAEEDAEDVVYVDEDEDDEFIKEEASAEELPETFRGVGSVPGPTEPVAAPLAPRFEQHRFDPLANGGARRRPWQRHVPDEGGSVEMPARPEHARVLPGRSRREN